MQRCAPWVTVSAESATREWRTVPPAGSPSPQTGSPPCCNNCSTWCQSSAQTMAAGNGSNLRITKVGVIVDHCHVGSARTMSRYVKATIIQSASYEETLESLRYRWARQLTATCCFDVEARHLWQPCSKELLLFKSLCYGYDEKRCMNDKRRNAL